MFAAKLPRLITHDKLLLADEITDDLKKFLNLIEPLHFAGKLGCLLIQLPPSFKLYLQRVESFFRLLPTDMRFAVEFRHPSWLYEETWRLLTQYNVAYTVVDEPLLPRDLQLTSDISYFRWHGRGSKPWYDYKYSVEELESWKSKIQEAERKTRRVYGFFNNHFHGYAVENCLELLQLTQLLDPNQEGALSRIKAFRKSRRNSLDSFMSNRTEAAFNNKSSDKV